MANSQYVLAVLGPTQFGKSSFVNAISGRETTRVGRGGQSCTSEIQLYCFPDALHLSSASATLCCFDVPGFDDTALRMKNSQILESMKLQLAGEKVNCINALLVFQSINESSIQLTRTLEYACKIFGDTIKANIVVILTKSDECTDSALLQDRKETIFDMCSKFQVECRIIMWTNDTSSRKQPVSVKDQQAAKLREKLASIPRPYQVNDMRQYDAAVQAEAKRLMNADPSRTVSASVDYQTQELIPRKVTEKFTTQTQVPKFETQAAQLEEAKRRQECDTFKVSRLRAREVQEERPVFKTISKQVPVKHTSYFLFFPIKTTQYVTTQEVVESKVQVSKTVYDTVEETAQHDINMYMRQIQGEYKTETINNERARTEYTPVTKSASRTVTIERSKLQDYMKQAAQNLARKAWQQGDRSEPESRRNYDF